MSCNNGAVGWLECVPHGAPLWIWAHRGARSVAPENTLAAAQAALEQEAHGWELDVHRSQDGRLVVVHDFALRRVTDIAARPEFPLRHEHVVGSLDWARLSTLDAGSWFARRDPFGTVANGVVSASRCAEFAGERIPSLEQALAWTLPTPLAMNIELKGPPTALDLRLPEDVAAVVRQMGMQERVLISSFQYAYLAHLHALDMDLPLAWLLTHDECALPQAEIILRLQAIGAVAVHAPLRGLAPGRVAQFREAGFAVQVYTVNRPEDMLWLAREGANGIFTDYPGLARSVLG